MRTHLLQIRYRLPRKSHQVLLDSQEYLSLYLTVIFPQKFEIRQQSSRHRILYSHHSRICRALVHAPVKTVECKAFHYIRHYMTMFLIEKPCSLFMKAALDSLYRNLLHFSKKRLSGAQTPDSINITI